MKTKRFLSLILAVALLLSLMPHNMLIVQATTTSDLVFSLNADGESYSVIGYREYPTGALDIPNTYNGKPVTSIGNSAFKNCDAITSVTTGDSVTTIGVMAFWDCGKLANVEMGSGVIAIGAQAFEYCDKLVSITIPDSVTNVSQYAFSHCESLRYNTYDNAKYLGNSNNPYVYLDQATTTDISACMIHENTRIIGPYAFAYCSNLTNIDLPNSVTSIGFGAFSSSDVASVTLSNSVTTIEGMAFYYCDKLMSITLPKNVATIGDNVFVGCRSLTGIWVNEDNPNFSNDNYGVLFNKDKTTIIAAPGTVDSYTVPAGVTSIGPGAFHTCDNLVGVVISDGVTTIGEWAFAYCNSLNYIILTNSVSTIGKNAFYWYDGSLENIWYVGTDVDRSNISIAANNSALKNANWHYNCIYFDNHIYLENTDVSCEVCNFTRDFCESHTYVNECDGICNICGYQRDRSHIYSNSCDEICNMCGEMRVITHNYKWIVDKEETCGGNGSKHEECTKCHEIRNDGTVITATGNHTLSGEEDTECDVCGHMFVFVEFNTNGGTSVSQIKVAANQQTILPSNPPVKSGYNFAGWSTTRAGNALYQSGDTIQTDKSITLYAQWNKHCETCSGTGKVACTSCSGTGAKKQTITCTECNGGKIMCDQCWRWLYRTRDQMEDLAELLDYNAGGIWDGTHSFGYRCPYCNNFGTVGRDGRYAFVECYTCYATGKETATVACEKCSGSGQRHCSNCAGSGEVIRTNVSAPDAPTLNSFNENSVTLNTILNGEYSLDGITWQDSPVFEKLETGREYSFYQRYAKTDTTYASAASAGVKVVAHNHISDGSECFGCNVVKGNCGGEDGGTNLTWILDAEGTLVISGTGKMADYSSSSDVPWYNVRSFIKNITIEAGVTNIGKYAFSDCSNLTSVSIPNSVTSIGDWAFYMCTGLTRVVIPDSVTTVGGQVFYQCKQLADVIIGNSVESIGSDVFSYCYSLTNLTIPGSLTAIDNYAFDRCGLTNVTISKDVSYINANAFSYCSRLIGIWVDGENLFYSSDDCGVLFNKDKTVLYRAPAKITGSYTIPDSVQTISNYAFCNCSELSSVNISDDVTSIGGYAFSRCSSLKSIIVPDSVTSVGDYAFDSCTGIKVVFYKGSIAEKNNIIFGTNNTWFSSRSWHYEVVESVFADQDCYYCASCNNYFLQDGSYAKATIVFKNWDGTVLSSNSLCYGDEVITPTNPTKAADNTYTYTFAGWDKEVVNCAGNATYTATYNISHTHTYQYGVCLQCGYTCGHNVKNDICTICRSYGTCGDNLTWALDKAGELTISGTGAMTNFSSPDLIPWHPFASQITNVTIGDSVANIGSWAFYDFTELDSVTIGNSVITIGEGAFSDCEGLTSITIPDSVTSIGDYAFYNCTKLTSITIPDSVTSIGDYVFQYCGNLTSITLPDSVRSIGVQAFYQCRNLTSVTIGNGVTSISKSMFSQCTGLTNITIPNSVTSIGDSAFYFCTSLTSITIPNSVTTIDEDTFAGCEGLTCITIPDSITSIGKNAFNCCNKLADVYITNPSAWLNINFYNNESNPLYYADRGHILDAEGNEVTELVLDSSMSVIPAYAFRNCTNLTSITIPDSGINIDEGAFAGCTIKKLIIADGSETITANMVVCGSTLQEVVIPESVTSIGSDTFHYCPNLTSITIPGSITTIGEGAFSGCTGLTSVIYCGTQEKWDTISIAWGNNPLTQATRNYHNYKNGVCAICGYNQECTIIFKNWNGTIISSKTYHWGDSVVAPTAPTKAADNTYTYAFVGWDKDVVDCAGDATYTATYTAIYIDYTVKFLNADGSIISKKTYHWGDAVTAPANPTKAADNTYTYAFNGWDQDVIGCAGNATYTATYSSTYIDYTVVFQNWNGTVLSTQTYHWGDTVTAPADPTKAADNTYTYAFAGWDKAVVTNCAGNATYTATYASTYIDYTVIFKNWNGTVLSTKTYHYGDAVSVPANPTRPNDSQYSYTFTGWDKTVVNCAGNATYTAVYTAKSLVPSTITSNKHTVSGNILSKIGVGTTAETLLGNLGEGRFASIYQGNKAVANNALIGTGMVVKIMDGSTVKVSATVVVTGDTNGDGKINITDMLAAKAHLLNKSKLSSVYAQAADTNSDGKINITDFIQMKAHILGKSKVEPQTVVMTAAI